MILAAGYSSRMGDFKPLLRIGNSSVVESVVRMFQDAGIEDVSVVVGHRAQELSPIVEATGARCVTNHQFDQGMYSSVRAGVAALSPSTEACFVIPADIPLVRASTIRRLANFFSGKDKAIVYPVFEQHRGHPPLISRAVLSEVLQPGSSTSLSALLAAHEDGACNLFVPDEGTRLDMDTPEEFARIRELAHHREIPTARECEALLAVYQAEDRVIRHSRAVADVACRLASALVASDVEIDSAMVRAGGMLHDVAKGQQSHASVGATLLQELGFENVARLVAVHNDYTFQSPKLDEAALVYLADKVVSGEHVVGLAQRFHRSFERFRDNPVALAAVLRRRTTAEAIAQEIERRLGVELQHVIGEVVSPTDGRLN